MSVFTPRKGKESDRVVLQPFRSERSARQRFQGHSPRAGSYSQRSKYNSSIERYRNLRIQKSQNSSSTLYGSGLYDCIFDGVTPEKISRPRSAQGLYYSRDTDALGASDDSDDGDIFEETILCQGIVSQASLPCHDDAYNYYPYVPDSNVNHKGAESYKLPTHGIYVEVVLPSKISKTQHTKSLVASSQKMDYMADSEKGRNHSMDTDTKPPTGSYRNSVAYQHQQNSPRSTASDYDELAKLDGTTSTESAADILDSFVLAWALGCYRSKSVVTSSEIKTLCWIARTTPTELAQTLETRYGVYIGTRDGPPENGSSGPDTAWYIGCDDFSSLVERHNHVLSSETHAIAGIVKALGVYLNPTSEKETADGRVISASRDHQELADKLMGILVTMLPGLETASHDNAVSLIALGAFNVAYERAPGNKQEFSWFADGFLDSVNAAVAKKSATLHEGKADQGSVRRSNRVVKRPISYDGFVDSSGIDDSLLNLSDHKRHRAVKTPTKAPSGTKGKRLATVAMKKGGESSNPSSGLLATGISPSQVIDEENAVVSVEGVPSFDLVVHREFKPLIFAGTEDEPPHTMVDLRVSKLIKKVRHQTQGLNEYAIDGFPVPVNPKAWLKFQKSKYAALAKAINACESVSVTLELSKRACLTELPYNVYMCRGCLVRQTDCNCRFKDVRLMTKVVVKLKGAGNEHVRFLLVPMFRSNLLPDQTTIKPSNINVPKIVGGTSDKRQDWITYYVLLNTAQTLLPTISTMLGIINEGHDDKSGKMVYGVHEQFKCSAQPCIFRHLVSGTRQFCDKCSTSILSTYFICSMCSVEICPKCFESWDDSDINTRTCFYGKNTGSSLSDIGFSFCKRLAKAMKGGPKVMVKHRKDQFMRVSQYTKADILAMHKKVVSVIDVGKGLAHRGIEYDCAGIVENQEEFSRKIASLESTPGEAWEIPVVYAKPGELTSAEFSRLWKKGTVVVVRGLLDILDASIWKPSWWIDNFGYETVEVLDCSQDAKSVGMWPLRDFYRLFDSKTNTIDTNDTAKETGEANSGNGAPAEAPADDTIDEANADDSTEWEDHRQTILGGILKLKDWPPTEDFKSRLPDHFARFMEALPFPEYTKHEGQFNIANRLPKGFVPPDLGPKMYCAYGSSDKEGGVGTTNLHCDMADAVNIMAYASKGFLEKHGISIPGIWTPDSESEEKQQQKMAAAVWDIYSPESLPALRAYIRGKYDMGETGVTGFDPVHDQSTFLTEPDRKALFEQFGDVGKCWRVYQNPGDAVFIPAGSAHQVCNYSNAIKIAMDFVAPERVKYCRQMTEDFRLLRSTHPRQSDLLQLSNVLWWVFAGKNAEVTERNNGNRKGKGTAVKKSRGRKKKEVVKEEEAGKDGDGDEEGEEKEDGDVSMQSEE